MLYFCLFVSFFMYAEKRTAKQVHETSSTKLEPIILPSNNKSSILLLTMLKSAPSKSLLRRLLTQLRLSTTTTITTTTRCGSSKSKTKKNLKKSKSTPKSTGNIGIIHSNSSSHHDEEDNRPTRPIIRIATFNASLFSMAPAVPEEGNSNCTEKRVKRSALGSCRSVSGPLGLPPKSILKQSPLHPNATNINNNNHNTTSTTNDRLSKSRLRVSINLPDNEISLGRSRRIASFSSENHHHHHHQLMKSKTIDSRTKITNDDDDNNMYSDRTVVDVLKELDLDIIALQEVKADEEMEMKPLSALANALGMTYVFGDSWAPEYGNAVLSKWPIKRCRVKKIVDDSDFRNVLKTTIEVPMYGEVNVYCTELDRLDEDWRMKQLHSIIHDDDDDDGVTPHILVGGLNSFDHTDYSKQRWNDILKYYEDIGKPTPRTEVMTHLKSNHKYIDAKDYAGEFESVVVIAKGQSVQGTCKYGTRVDYILSSPNSPYAFVPGSYSVFSSKGTSDHHIVKVDLHLPNNNLANHHHQHNHDYATDNNHNKMMKHTSRRRQQDGEDGAVPVPVAYNNNNTSSFNKLYKGVGSIFRKNNTHNNPICIV